MGGEIGCLEKVVNVVPTSRSKDFKLPDERRKGKGLALLVRRFDRSGYLLSATAAFLLVCRRKSLSKETGLPLELVLCRSLAVLISHRL